MSGGDRNPEAVAFAKGLVVVYPAENELFVDIDSAEDLARFDQGKSVLWSIISAYRKAPSPSGKEHHFHITVTLVRPVKDAFERIALQAIMGSDRLHEALSWANAERGQRAPTCFFEKPPAQLPAAPEARLLPAPEGEVLF